MRLRGGPANQCGMRPKGWQVEPAPHQACHPQTRPHGLIPSRHLLSEPVVGQDPQVGQQLLAPVRSTRRGRLPASLALDLGGAEGFQGGSSCTMSGRAEAQGLPSPRPPGPWGVPASLWRGLLAVASLRVKATPQASVGRGWSSSH